MVQIEGKVLICDPIDDKGASILKNNGFSVDILTTITPSELISIASNYDVIVVRSRTKITKEVISSATKAKIIARVGVGLDNIDLEEVTKKKNSYFEFSRVSYECSF